MCCIMLGFGLPYFFVQPSTQHTLLQLPLYYRTTVEAIVLLNMVGYTSHRGPKPHLTNVITHTHIWQPVTPPYLGGQQHLQVTCYSSGSMTNMMSCFTSLLPHHDYIIGHHEDIKPIGLHSVLEKFTVRQTVSDVLYCKTVDSAMGIGATAPAREPLCPRQR
jgi:hypothetical protein